MHFVVARSLAGLGDVSGTRHHDRMSGLEDPRTPFYDGHWEVSRESYESFENSPRNVAVVTPDSGVWVAYDLGRLGRLLQEHRRAAAVIQDYLHRFPEDEPHFMSEMIVLRKNYRCELKRAKL
jgi:hypothetical protein